MSKLRLTTLVYNCTECNQDTTFLVDRVSEIRRTINVECPYSDCPSRGG